MHCEELNSILAKDPLIIRQSGAKADISFYAMPSYEDIEQLCRDNPEVAFSMQQIWGEYRESFVEQDIESYISEYKKKNGVLMDPCIEFMQDLRDTVSRYYKLASQAYAESLFKSFKKDPQKLAQCLSEILKKGQQVKLLKGDRAAMPLSYISERLCALSPDLTDVLIAACPNITESFMEVVKAIENEAGVTMEYNLFGENITLPVNQVGVDVLNQYLSISDQMTLDEMIDIIKAGSDISIPCAETVLFLELNAQESVKGKSDIAVLKLQKEFEYAKQVNLKLIRGYVEAYFDKVSGERNVKEDMGILLGYIDDLTPKITDTEATESSDEDDLTKMTLGKIVVTMQDVYQERQALSSYNYFIDKGRPYVIDRDFH